MPKDDIKHPYTELSRLCLDRDRKVALLEQLQKETFALTKQYNEKASLLKKEEALLDDIDTKIRHVARLVAETKGQ